MDIGAPCPDICDSIEDAPSYVFLGAYGNETQGQGAVE